MPRSAPEDRHAQDRRQQRYRRHPGNGASRRPCPLRDRQPCANSRSPCTHEQQHRADQVERGRSPRSRRRRRRDGMGLWLHVHVHRSIPLVSSRRRWPGWPHRRRPRGGPVTIMVCWVARSGCHGYRSRHLEPTPSAHDGHQGHGGGDRQHRVDGHLEAGLAEGGQRRQQLHRCRRRRRPRTPHRRRARELGLTDLALTSRGVHRLRLTEQPILTALPPATPLAGANLTTAEGSSTAPVPSAPRPACSARSP